MEINSVYPSDPEEISEKDVRNLWPKGQNNAADTRRRPLAMIVAVGRDGAIGRNGDLIRHLPGDLARFKQLTMGHTVIMGRKTWESLPSKPLPGRHNIVITRSADYTPEGAQRASSLSEAIAMADADPLPFIIGGGTIYEQALPLASHLYLTMLDADTPDADTFFPLPDPTGWRVTAESEPMMNKRGEEFRFIDMIRREG